jgi:protein phosphatase
MWEKFETDWFCLDCEILPWSAKAEELLRRQYAAVGAASRPALSEAVAALGGAEERDLDVDPLLTDYRERREAVESYVETYRRYCWPVHSLDDIKVAPFHLLATEGAVHVDKDHLWHLLQLARLCAADDGLLFPTGNMTVDVTNAESVEDGVRWWEEITGRGGEGMVVKPLDFVARGRRGLAQPGIKCRGREYLRIIYGPEYNLPENLDRLRGRRLSAKRSLASREFALGVEALERFVRRDPLYKVHECVFGVLALESEPVDPRL